MKTLIANFVVCHWILLLLQSLCIADIEGNKYDMQELCNVRGGSVRLSLDQGSYAQLELVVAPNGGPGTKCEIVVQTTHSGDGLLMYFEHFDFVGSNFATVFQRENCGSTLLKAWNGEFHYLSSCIGSEITKSPPMTIVSSLGAMRLQLMPTNVTTSEVDFHYFVNKPITFKIVATASRKAVSSDHCPSGCCNAPYTFRCPLLNQCIDMKLTCNNITNCGPPVHLPRDENGALCQGIDQLKPGTALHQIVAPTDIQSLITNYDADGDNSGDKTDTLPPSLHSAADMLRPMWESSEAGHDSSSTSNAEIPQVFYSRIELVCGIVSIALFCLAGIAVLVCKSKQTNSLAAFIDSRRPSAVAAAFVTTSEENTAAAQRNVGTAHVSRTDDNLTSVFSIVSEMRHNSENQRNVTNPTGTDNGGGGAVTHYMAVRPKPQHRSSLCHCLANGSSHDGCGDIYYVGIEDDSCGGNRCCCSSTNGPCACSDHPPPPYEALYPK